MRKLLRTLVVPLVAVTFVVGCGDDIGANIGADSTPVEVAAALAGTWNATSLVFTSKANTSETFDLLAAGGSCIITFTANGQYSGSSTLGGFTEAVSGTYVVQGTNLLATYTGETESVPVAFTLSGNTLNISFDGGEGETPFTATFVRG